MKLITKILLLSVLSMTLLACAMAYKNTSEIKSYALNYNTKMRAHYSPSKLMRKYRIWIPGYSFAKKLMPKTFGVLEKHMKKITDWGKNIATKLANKFKALVSPFEKAMMSVEAAVAELAVAFGEDLNRIKNIAKEEGYKAIEAQKKKIQKLIKNSKAKADQIKKEIIVLTDLAGDLVGKAKTKFLAYSKNVGEKIMKKIGEVNEKLSSYVKKIKSLTQAQYKKLVASAKKGFNAFTEACADVLKYTGNEIIPLLVRFFDSMKIE